MNKNLIEAGNATQFKDGNTPTPRPANAVKPWSITNALRKLACEEKDGKVRARRVAEAMFDKADSGDVAAAQFITERTDGKVPQTNVNATFTDIQNMTDEELNDFIARNTGAPIGNSGGDTGEAAPGGSAGDDAEGRPEHKETGNPPSV